MCFVVTLLFIMLGARTFRMRTTETTEIEGPLLLEPPPYFFNVSEKEGGRNVERMGHYGAFPWPTQSTQRGPFGVLQLEVCSLALRRRPRARSVVLELKLIHSL